MDISALTPQPRSHDLHQLSLLLVKKVFPEKFFWTVSNVFIPSFNNYCFSVSVGPGSGNSGQLHFSVSKVLPLPRDCPKHRPMSPLFPDPTDLLGALFPFLCSSAREKDEEPFPVDPSAFLFPFSDSSGNQTGECVLARLCPPPNLLLYPSSSMAPIMGRA